MGRCDPSSAQVLSASGLLSLGDGGAGSNLRGGGRFEYRYRWSNDAQLGLRVGLFAVDAPFIEGFRGRDALETEVLALSNFQLLRGDSAGIHLRLLAGARFLADAADAPESSSTQVGAVPAWIASIHLNPSISVRTGVVFPVWLEVDPSADIAELATLLTVGVDWAFSPSLSLYADVETGGSFGFDGNGLKYVAEGTTGLRIRFGPGAAEFRNY